jgi:predicted RNA-binding Zn-ribbon protein involved in translation (DUF1610 family)
VASITKPVEGPFSCSECGNAKPDTDTWPQACPNCGSTIWTTTVRFSRDELDQVAGGDDR